MKAILEFDYPIKTNEGIVFKRHKEKIIGTIKDFKEHLRILKAYGNMFAISIILENGKVLI